MAAKKADKKLLITKEPAQTSSSSLWLDYFKFGESYTSLVLGIVVVIITTVLLVFLVRDRNLTQMAGQQSVSSTQTSNGTNGQSNQIAQAATVTPTKEPTSTPFPTATRIPTSTPRPTFQPTRRPTLAPTARPTMKATAAPSRTANPTATAIPTRRPLPTATKAIVKPTTVPTQIAQNISPVVGKGRVHTVAAGENLWAIAERYYRSGYNWVDIARVNNLSNPGVIASGTKLTIPDVNMKTITVDTKGTQEDFGPKITGTTYKVQKGDHLWGIAVRAYGDGYKWSELARVNNITTPSVIHVGLELKVPRTQTSAPAIK